MINMRKRNMRKRKVEMKRKVERNMNMKKNRIAAILLAFSIILPVLAVNTVVATDPAAEARADILRRVHIDYVAETLWVIPAANVNLVQSTANANVIDDATTSATAALAVRSGNIGGSGGRPPEFMYALRAIPNRDFERGGRFYIEAGETNTATASAAARVLRARNRRISALEGERWFPIHGGGIDISRIIPTNARRLFYIAIRCANDTFDSLNGFPTRVAFPVRPRYGGRFNNALAYDAVNERIVLSGNAPPYFGGSVNVVYQFDLFAPVTATLATATGIDVPADRFSLGATVNISTAAQTLTINATDTSFARSRNVRFRIPARPNAPNVRVDVNSRRIAGMRVNGFEYSVTDPDDFVYPALTGANWRTYAGTATVPLPDMNAFDSAFPGIRAAGPGDGGYYRVWVRVAPVDGRAPASLPSLIEVPASLFAEPQNGSDD